MTAKLLATADEQSFAAAGADIVCDVVRTLPNAVLTLATGKSAMPIYRVLAEWVDRPRSTFLARPLGRRYVPDRPADR